MAAEYARGLHARGREIAIAARALRLAPDDAARRSEAVMLAQRMRDTANAYRFQVVSAAADRLVDALVRAGTAQAHSNGWATADAALAELCRAVDAARPPGDLTPATERAAQTPGATASARGMS